MATTDDQLVTAKGLADTLAEVAGGGSSPLDAWPVNSVMVVDNRYSPSQVGIPGRWAALGLIPLQRGDGSPLGYVAAYLREQ